MFILIYYNANAIKITLKAKEQLSTGTKTTAIARENKILIRRKRKSIKNNQQNIVR